MTTPRPKLSERLKARPLPDLGLCASVGTSHPVTPPAARTPDDTEQERMVAFFLKASADAYTALREAEPDDRIAPGTPAEICC